MNIKKMSKSVISVLLAALMLCGSICLPVSGAVLNDNTVKRPDFLWEIDFEEMQSMSDNGGSTDFTLSHSEEPFLPKFSEIEGQKVMGTSNSNFAYFIKDTANVLKEYDAYYIEADMYFESFPQGTAGGETPRTYPMSFMTWITENSTGHLQYGSIRVDDEGYLCKSASEGTRLSDTAKLPLKEWFNIRFIVSPKNRQCEVFINHESVGSYGITMHGLSAIAGSRVRFFDTRYNYSVWFKNISVTSDSDYRIGTLSEPSADFIGYQTTKPVDGKFDLRLISGLDSRDYNRVGCTVYEVSRKNGEIETNEYELLGETVYESIKATDESGKTSAVTAAELGVKYLSAFTMEDLEAPEDDTLLIIRPWVRKNGVKIYGKLKQINFGDATENGYPVLSEVTEESQYILYASDDTYIGGKYQNSKDISVHGSDPIIGMKYANEAASSPYNRQAYLKFELNDAAKAVMKNADSIRLEICGGRFSYTAAETERGGVEALVSVVDTAWTEDDLTRETADATAEILGELGTMMYGPNTYYGMDVTEYVKDTLYADAVAFRIENVHMDGQAERSLQSKEAEDGEFAPRLVISTSQLALNYEIELSKLNNAGAEPWGYAEKLVNDWFEGGERDKVYAETYDMAALSKPANDLATGDYTVYNPVLNVSGNSYVRTLSTLSNYKQSTETLYDEFGGIMNSDIKGKKTGFFHAEVIDGKHYIIDPIGNPFYAMAVNSVNSGSTGNQREETIAKYGSEEKFYKAIVDELPGLFGLNTVTTNETGYEIFMKEGLTCIISVSGLGGYMGTMGLGTSRGGSSSYYYNNTMNVFEPDYDRYIDKSIAGVTEKYKNEPYLLGYTVDNELPGGDDILMRYLTIPADEPVNAFSYATAWTWLKAATGKLNPTLDDATMELSQEFLAFVYNRYGKVIAETFDKYDPNHMYLGGRAYGPCKDKEGYLRAMGLYVDIFTINMYGRQDYTSINESIEKIYKYSGKPIIVSEFGMRALESVDLNGYRLGNHTDTACWLFETQEQRAASYESYVLNLIESGVCLGWTLYRFQDNDQSLFKDAQGNIYSLSSGQNALEPAYTNVETGARLVGIEVEQIHKGETDISNLNHNKGIYDNHMEPYLEMMDSMKAISENLLSLIDYFAK